VGERNAVIYYDRPADEIFRVGARGGGKAKQCKRRSKRVKEVVFMWGNQKVHRKALTLEEPGKDVEAPGY